MRYENFAEVYLDLINFFQKHEMTRMEALSMAQILMHDYANQSGMSFEKYCQFLDCQKDHYKMVRAKWGELRRV